MEENFYVIDDNISFRKCSLYNGRSRSRGNCTDFYNQDEHWVTYFHCRNDGIHFHCTKHPQIELEAHSNYGSTSFTCPKCKNSITGVNTSELTKKCLRMINMEEFKNAKLIRLDDWYYPEISKKVSTDSDYFITANVKTDKDGDTIVVLYIGVKGHKEKVQYFIKPEKCQLTNDHKDLDPAEILSKIEVTLRNRKISREFEF